LGNSFDFVGTVERGSSGKSLKIALNDLPFTTFTHTFYVGVKAVEDFLEGHKKTATVYVLKPQMRVAPAAKAPDL